LRNSLKSSQFKSVLNNSKVYSFNNIKFKYQKSLSGSIGFAINKKLGSAVERNSFKRRCRSEFNKMKDFSINLIVLPKTNVNKAGMGVVSAFEKLKNKIYND
tara:strand:- start:184 stop:489 length:306 start_codon:yes stop_codon:yes gene_type:complete